MKSYPVSVRRESYSGTDPRKRSKVQEFNRVATKIEEHLNADLSRRPEHTVQTYASTEIAQEIGESSDLVHRIVFATDCGANGITIIKGDLDKAMNIQRGDT